VSGKIAYLANLLKVFLKHTNLNRTKKLIFLNTSDILLGKVLNKNTENSSKLPGQAKQRIQKGDLIFREIRPENGRYAYIDFDAEKYVVSAKLMVLRCNFSHRHY
jgi:type I restriction enzyme, S subunit